MIFLSCFSLAVIVYPEQMPCIFLSICKTNITFYAPPGGQVGRKKPLILSEWVFQVIMTWQIFPNQFFCLANLFAAILPSFYSFRQCFTLANKYISFIFFSWRRYRYNMPAPPASPSGSFNRGTRQEENRPLPPPPFSPSPSPPPLRVVHLSVVVVLHNEPCLSLGYCTFGDARLEPENVLWYCTVSPRHLQ